MLLFDDIILQKIMIKKASRNIQHRYHNQTHPIQTNHDAKRSLPLLNKVHFKTCHDDKSELGQMRSRDRVSTSKKMDFVVQQIQLEQSKWLIFNEEQARNSSTYSLRKNGISNMGRMARMTAKAKMNENKLHINLNDFNQQSHAFHPITTTAATQKSIKSLNRTKNENADSMIKQLKSQTEQKRLSKKECSKSNRSYKSIKSNCMNKTLQEQQLTPQEINNPQALIIPLASTQQQQDKFLLIKLYNQIELLNPPLKQYHHLDLYEYYQSTLSIDRQTQTNKHEEQILQIRKTETAPQRNIQHSLLPPSIQDAIKQSQNSSNAFMQSPVFVSKDRQGKGKMVSFEQLTTKATQMYPQERYRQDLVSTQVKMEQIQVVKMPQLLQELNKFSEVRFIKIDHNAQTALFPCKSMSQYVHSIPSTSSLHNSYKNQQMLAFLNHLLFSYSQVIRNVFERPSKDGFKCNLYDGQELTTITVDGVFPFDSNFYPLYGHIDHFIWFPVLIKCFAQLKGSYSAVNRLDHKQIFQLLTGQQLVKIDLKWDEAKSLKDLKIVVKQAQAQSIFTTIKYKSKFYQINKIQTKINKNKQHKQPTNTPTAMEQQNYKTLSSFIRKQKRLNQKRELFQSTLVIMRGFQGPKKLAYSDLIKEQFQIYTSDNKIVNDMGSK